MISLEALTEDYEDASSYSNIKQFGIGCKNNTSEDPLRLEIDALKSRLCEYEFSFMDIVKCSPKAQKTRIACARAAVCVLDNMELLTDLKRSKLLPVKRIEALTGISRKITGRHRNYIVCLIEILSGEYAYLAEYLRFVREV